ncbi:hypothetical protein CDCA_CDCA06G1875 [Cyanidium caldarium]|uniref:P-type ATPase A domain-containing protein n=1 Tax=Cyanidium caldarium TaxID=2771 RepID=A0AAV9IU85_CYACA|nr:hypothetical protein CDCA_CDCA06G1875 [Cyanidium caldarium]
MTRPAMTSSPVSRLAFAVASSGHRRPARRIPFRRAQGGWRPGKRPSVALVPGLFSEPGGLGVRWRRRAVKLQMESRSEHSTTSSASGSSDDEDTTSANDGHASPSMTSMGCCRAGATTSGTETAAAVPWERPPGIEGALHSVIEWRERLHWQLLSAALFTSAVAASLLLRLPIGQSVGNAASIRARHQAARVSLLALLWWKRLALAVSLTLSGLPAVLESALSFVRQPALSVDLLMTLAAVLMLAAGHTIEGSLLMVLFSLSRASESAIQARARRDLNALRDRVPERAWLLTSATDDAANDDGLLEETQARAVPVAQLQPGDCVLVKNGELNPCDARVERGDAYVSLEAITGESVPRRVTRGDAVSSGARVIDSSMVVRVERRADESTLARIARLVTEAQHNKPTLERWIDRFGRAYSVGVLVGAALIAALAAPLHNWDWQAQQWRPEAQRIGWAGQRGALDRALAFLVVASPCALVIGAPVAYTSALGALARRGVLVKGGARALEAAARCRRVAFDKTGTLTLGLLRLEDVRVVDAAGAPAAEEEGERGGHWRGDGRRRRLLAMAAALEVHATHPIAKAVVEAAAASTTTGAMYRAESVQVRAGQGVEGRLVPLAGGDITAHTGRVRFGRAEFAVELLDIHTSRQVSQRVQQVEREEAQRGRSTSVLCGEDGTVAVFALSDRLRPDARDCVDELHAAGYRVDMLTGDTRETAMAMARASGIGAESVWHGLTPDDKLRYVEQRADTLMMVGDGMNDAPALARARTGVSIGLHSATAASVSDVILMEDRESGIRRLAWLLRKSRDTQQLVYQNVAAALMLIVGTAVGAATGGLPLWMAVLLHEGGTLAVGLNGLRLLWDAPVWKKKAATERVAGWSAEDDRQTEERQRGQRDATSSVA